MKRNRQENTPSRLQCLVFSNEPKLLAAAITYQVMGGNTRYSLVDDKRSKVQKSRTQKSYPGVNSKTITCSQEGNLTLIKSNICSTQPGVGDLLSVEENQSKFKARMCHHGASSFGRASLI